ncbi:hypothetical protein [Mycobacteroides chelonae]|nr:hypothetical protein [Mycobacteroides chelonae]
MSYLDVCVNIIVYGTATFAAGVVIVGLLLGIGYVLCGIYEFIDEFRS